MSEKSANYVAMLDRKAVCEMFGIGRDRVAGLVEAGLLTAPLMLLNVKHRWPSDECRAIFEAERAGKNADQIKILVQELMTARQVGVSA